MIAVRIKNYNQFVHLWNLFDISKEPPEKSVYKDELGKRKLEMNGKRDSAFFFVMDSLKDWNGWCFDCRICPVHTCQDKRYPEGINEYIDFKDFLIKYAFIFDAKKLNLL